MRVTAFFSLACILTWSVLLTGISRAAGGFGPLLSGTDIQVSDIVPYIFVGSFGPSLAALIMILTGPRPLASLKAWGMSLIRIKSHPLVWALALLVLPVSALVFCFATGMRPAAGQEPLLVYLTLLIAPLNGLVAIFAGAGPLGEEPGWRGFALPRLLDRMGALGASLALGLVWTLWHWPMMLIPSWRGDGMSVLEFAPFYTLVVLMLAYMMTRLFQWSRGNVLMAIWFHAIANSVMPIMADPDLWAGTDVSDLERGVRVLGPLLLGALAITLIGMTPFARRRNASWRSAQTDAEQP